MDEKIIYSGALSLVVTPMNGESYTIPCITKRNLQLLKNDVEADTRKGLVTHVRIIASDKAAPAVAESAHKVSICLNIPVKVSPTHDSEVQASFTVFPNDSKEDAEAKAAKTVLPERPGDHTPTFCLLDPAITV
ncbi:MAG: hypothetical protein WC464_00415 [Bdellovibrionales bacterium]